MSEHNMDLGKVQVATPASVDSLQKQAAAARRKHGELEKLATDTEAKIGRVSPDLRPEVAKERIAAIRKEAEEAATTLMKELKDEADLARRQGRNWSRESLFRRAQFAADPVADATVRLAWQGRLARANEQVLIEFALDAKASGNLALAAMILDEASSRGANLDTARAVGGIIGSIEPPELANASKALDEVAYFAKSAEHLWRTLRGAPPSPIERANLGRMQNALSR